MSSQGPIRLCFYNPHSVYNTLGETVISKLAQVFGTDKSKLKSHNQRHDYLLSYLRDRNFNSAIVIDGYGTSFDAIFPNSKVFRNYFIRQLVSYTEIYIWCFLNRINPFSTPIIFSVRQLDSKTDLLFTFGYCSYMFTTSNNLAKSIIGQFRGKKIVHLSHFYSQTGKISKNINKAGVRCVVAEANLKSNLYFQKYFSFIKDVITLPHVLREKYKKKQKFSSRSNKCLALGTLVINIKGDPLGRDYFRFFKIDTLHPMRKSIYLGRKKNCRYIDSLISFHNQKTIQIQSNPVWYQKNNFIRFLYNLFFVSESKEYHNLDIVSKYNEYKMFVSPEENIGLPSVNFVEGVACGCAYLGLDHSMYTDLGMKDGFNYIAYDGTLQGLVDKVAYYQRHPKRLRTIARNGQKLVLKEFNRKKVMMNFWNSLCDLNIAK